MDKTPEQEEAPEHKVKYPFSGVATNLIDKFLVLGYDQKIIDYTFRYLKNQDGKPELNTRFDFFNFEPSIKFSNYPQQSNDSNNRVKKENRHRKNNYD